MALAAGLEARTLLVSGPKRLVAPLVNDVVSVKSIHSTGQNKYAHRIRRLILNASDRFDITNHRSFQSKTVAETHRAVNSGAEPPKSTASYLPRFAGHRSAKSLRGGKTERLASSIELPGRKFISHDDPDTSFGSASKGSDLISILFARKELKLGLTARSRGQAPVEIANAPISTLIERRPRDSEIPGRG
jgi:hypothetical protein